VRMPARLCPGTILSLLLLSTPVFAQAPAPPPPPPAGPWVGSVTAGLALTSGNKDTSTLNLGYDMVYDPKTRNLLKSEGLFLRGKSDGELTADRLALNGRDEYTLRDGMFLFGQLQYLQDQFKDIDYLVAPTGGLGYRFVDSERTKLSGDAGLGGVWEKPPLMEVKASGAVVLSEKLTQMLSTSATLNQSLSALYKTNDFDDALYAFGVSLAVSVTTRTQLKVEVLDTYKNAVAAGIEKNDVAFIVGMVLKR
jgi:putative salt-induced outer membrane protein